MYVSINLARFSTPRKSTGWRPFRRRAPMSSNTGMRVCGQGCRIADPDGVAQPRQAGWAGENDEKYDGHPGVRSISIEGPYDIVGLGNSESRERLLVCQPTETADEASCARTILSTFARRAYRRSLTDDDVGKLMELFRTGRAEGGASRTAFAWLWSGSW